MDRANSRPDCDWNWRRTNPSSYESHEGRDYTNNNDYPPQSAPIGSGGRQLSSPSQRSYHERANEFSTRSGSAGRSNSLESNSRTRSSHAQYSRLNRRDSNSKSVVWHKAGAMDALDSDAEQCQ